jgi:hypothetical protein
MDEEEKKAIDILKDFTENEDTKYCYDWQGFDYETILSAIECLLNLIEKQQRIMKSQEKIIMEQEKEIDNYKKQEFGNLFNGKYISKDKIRDKIDEYRQLRKYIIKSSKELELLIKNIPDFERIDFCIGMLEDLIEDKGEDE